MNVLGLFGFRRVALQFRMFHDRHVPQLTPALDLVLCLHLDQSIGEPELDKFVVIKVADTVESLFEVTQIPKVDHRLDEVRFLVLFDLDVLFASKFLVELLFQTGIEGEFVDQLSYVLVQLHVLVYFHQILELVQTRLEVLELCVLLVFRLGLHVPKSKRGWYFLHELHRLVQL